MAQGMEFRWMGGHPNDDELVRMEAARQDAQDLAQLQKANANATRAYDWMALGEQLGTSGAYQEAMAKQAAQEAQKAADMQRIKELQAKIEADKASDMQRIKELQEGIEADKARMREDPRMQVAAMMMMGGNGGALQSLLVSDFQKEIQAEQKKADEKKAAQRELDALENSLSTNMMVLSKTDKDQIDRFKQTVLPVFWNKFNELTDAGATSRMGGSNAWKEVLKQFEVKGNDKKDAAKKSKEKKEREGNAVFTPR